MKWPNDMPGPLARAVRPAAPAAPAAASGIVPPCAAGAAALATACYDNEVPAFAEAHIERLYGSLFSTLPHFRHSGKLTPATSTYVTRHNGSVDTVLLFQLCGNRVTVLNELILLSGKEVHAFAAFIFARYPAVACIDLNAVSADLDGLPYPFQRYVCAEDIVVAPLTSIDAYTARLSKNTRKSMRRHTNAILREHPSYRYAVVPPDEVTDDLVRHIIGFNKARMADKERISAYTDKETEWILALVRARGMVSVITIDGQVCAGAVCCNVGGRYFMLVGAHDPAYDQFSLGTLICYQSICSCIERGGTELHLLWGRHPYKTSLCGIPRRFERIALYRSRAAYLRHALRVLAAALSGHAREARLWLVNAEDQDSFQGRMAARLWRVMRPTKRVLRAAVSTLRSRLLAR